MKDTHRLLRALRQHFCAHRCYLEDIVRVGPERVECPCHRCGLQLSALYGAALDCKFDRKVEPFSVGDTVRLRAGGPPMTVEIVFGFANDVQCAWFESDGVSLRRSRFKDYALVQAKNDPVPSFAETRVRADIARGARISEGEIPR